MKKYTQKAYSNLLHRCLPQGPLFHSMLSGPIKILEAMGDVVKKANDFLVDLKRELVPYTSSQLLTEWIEELKLGEDIDVNWSDDKKRNYIKLRIFLQNNRSFNKAKLDAIASFYGVRYTVPLYDIHLLSHTRDLGEVPNGKEPRHYFIQSQVGKAVMGFPVGKEEYREPITIRYVIEDESEDAEFRAFVQKHAPSIEVLNFEKVAQL